MIYSLNFNYAGFQLRLQHYVGNEAVAIMTNPEMDIPNS